MFYYSLSVSHGQFLMASTRKQFHSFDLRSNAVTKFKLDHQTLDAHLIFFYYRYLIPVLVVDIAYSIFAAPKRSAGLLILFLEVVFPYNNAKQFKDTY